MGKSKNPKSGKIAKTRTPKQQKALEERQARENLMNAEQAAAQRLAQVVNLKIAGHSFAAIGKAIGCTADEVETMLQRDAGAFVRTQPALRGYVRNFISEKMSGLLDATYSQAINKNRPDQLDYVASVQRTLKGMADLYGANAPTQSEVTVDAAPEAVERLVQKFANQRGVGYDLDVFDLDDDDVEEIAEIVEEAHTQVQAALESSSEAVEQAQDGDEDL